MDEFIGHLDEERIQRLEDHLAETARLAGLFAEPFGMKDAGVLLGKNHDLGKYSSSFQAYKREEETGRRSFHGGSPVSVGSSEGAGAGSPGRGFLYCRSSCRAS
mgnify:CR=1 FL=1